MVMKKIIIAGVLLGQLSAQAGWHCYTKNLMLNLSDSVDGAVTGELFGLENSQDETSVFLKTLEGAEVEIVPGNDFALLEEYQMMSGEEEFSIAITQQFSLRNCTRVSCNDPSPTKKYNAKVFVNDKHKYLSCYAQ